MNAHRTGLISALALALVLSAGCSSQPSAITAPLEAAAAPDPGHSGVVLLEDFAGRQIFPASDGWNLDASQAPVDSNSQAYIDLISRRTAQNPGGVCRLSARFGPPPWGIPYVGVSGKQALLPVTFDNSIQSDPAAPGRPVGYPIPEEAKLLPSYLEGNLPGGGTAGDRHMIVVDRDNGLLFETWATRWNADAGRWEAGSGATFSLSAGAVRPHGWTSADAAGLAIFPGLVRYDEAYGEGEITHAFRTTCPFVYEHVWPASHTEAGGVIGAPPLGARLRLKASVDLSGYAPQIQRIFRAMQKYGLIIADSGGDGLGVTGTMDARWNGNLLNPAFGSLTADDFEVVQLGWGQPN